MKLLQSLDRGLKTLDILHCSDKPMQLTKLAQALNVNKSNIAHVLKTLIAAGYVNQDDNRKYYAIQKPIYNYSAITLREVIKYKEICRPYLEYIVETTQECAHMAVLVDEQVWYADKIDSPHSLKVDHQIGNLSPLHCTALGKVFLAFGDMKIPMNLSRCTSKTIVDIDSLKQEIAEIKNQGYALDNEEYSPGVRCVARPVYNSNGNLVVALGLSGPSARINSNKLAEMGNLLRSTVIALK